MFRLQLSTASGSAAALAMPVMLVAAAAPAKATPVESSARRSSRPLAATCWISFLGFERRDPAMRASLFRECLFYPIGAARHSSHTDITLAWPTGGHSAA